MLFRNEVLEGIRSGSVAVAFRRWQRPSVRAGGTLLTAAGQLGIGAVERVAPSQITEADARRAGYASRAALLQALDERSHGDVIPDRARRARARRAHRLARVVRAERPEADNRGR